MPLYFFTLYVYVLIPLYFALCMLPSPIKKNCSVDFLFPFVFCYCVYCSCLIVDYFCIVYNVSSYCIFILCLLSSHSVLWLLSRPIVFLCCVYCLVPLYFCIVNTFTSHCTFACVHFRANVLLPELCIVSHPVAFSYFVCFFVPLHFCTGHTFLLYFTFVLCIMYT